MSAPTPYWLQKRSGELLPHGVVGDSDVEILKNVRFLEFLADGEGEENKTWSCETSVVDPGRAAECILRIVFCGLEYSGATLYV